MKGACSNASCSPIQTLCTLCQPSVSQACPFHMCSLPYCSSHTVQLKSPALWYTVSNSDDEFRRQYKHCCVSSLRYVVSPPIVSISDHLVLILLFFFIFSFGECHGSGCSFDSHFFRTVCKYRLCILFLKNIFCLSP